MSQHQISIQTIVYGHSPNDISRWCDSIDSAAALLSKSASNAPRFVVTIGDCSQTPCLSETDVKELGVTSRSLDSIDYTFFDANLGSAAGHNKLASTGSTEFLMTINPDTVVAPSCLAEMYALTDDKKTAVVEAIQIPLEHPKVFDLETGDTSWASTCCALIRRNVFNEVGGFDDAHFFLHCDDVDFSWMVRSAGYRVRIAPRAVIFHHHGFDENNAYVATAAEIRYSALGSLMLFAKWGRSDLLESSLKHFREHPEIYKVVLDDWKEHETMGTIPAPRNNTDVAEFIDGAFAQHRW